MNVMEVFFVMVTVELDEALHQVEDGKRTRELTTHYARFYGLHAGSKESAMGILERDIEDGEIVEIKGGACGVSGIPEQFRSEYRESDREGIWHRSGRMTGTAETFGLAG